jgi:hypothetical protein
MFHIGLLQWSSAEKAHGGIITYTPLVLWKGNTASLKIETIKNWLHRL